MEIAFGYASNYANPIWQLPRAVRFPTLGIGTPTSGRQLWDESLKTAAIAEFRSKVSHHVKACRRQLVYHRECHDPRKCEIWESASRHRVRTDFRLRICLLEFDHHHPENLCHIGSVLTHCRFQLTSFLALLTVGAPSEENHESLSLALRLTPITIKPVDAVKIHPSVLTKRHGDM